MKVNLCIENPPVPQGEHHTNESNIEQKDFTKTNINKSKKYLPKASWGKTRHHEQIRSNSLNK